MTKKNSRTGGEPRHLRLYEWFTRSAAWRSLDVYERALYIEFKQRYNGSNNGNIGFSGEEMRAALNCSNKPADRALRTLIERGFIKRAAIGHFDWKWRKEGGSRSSTYILTEHAVDYPLKVLSGPTKEFMRWQPPATARGDDSTPMRGRHHPIKKDMGGRQHPNGMPTSPEMADVANMNGVPTSPTYNIPQGGSEKRPGQPDPSRHKRKAA